MALAAVGSLGAALAGHGPQSAGQLPQFSPPQKWQAPSPHAPRLAGHAPQSYGQVEQLSLASQTALPQAAAQLPQSPQVAQVSLAPHTPSPQAARARATGPTYRERK